MQLGCGSSGPGSSTLVVVLLWYVRMYSALLLAAAGLMDETFGSVAIRGRYGTWTEVGIAQSSPPHGR